MAYDVHVMYSPPFEGRKRVPFFAGLQSPNLSWWVNELILGWESNPWYSIVHIKLVGNHGISSPPRGIDLYDLCMSLGLSSTVIL